MMKLLFKPTGNIFTLPDAEALRIKASDRGNYEILNTGITIPEAPKTVTQEEVTEIVAAKEEEIKAENKAIADKEAKEEAKEARKARSKARYGMKASKPYDTNIETMAKPELAVFAQKLGIVNTSDKTKAQIIAEIKELKGE